MHRLYGLIANAAFAHAAPTRPSTRCRRPRRQLLVKVTAAGTLWVRPEHVGSMATTTTDDIPMVYGDGVEGVNETRAADLRAYTSQALPVHGMLGGGTQCMRVSAAIE